MEEITDHLSSKQLSGKKKKKLYTKINTQMEFYFSDSNLAKDKFLQNLINQDSEGYVDLEIFKTFNKLKELTEDIDVIAAAVSKSNILQVNEDKTRIRRVAPLGKPKDFDACTLYVEKLPSYVDHKWIKDVFENFGTVDHINIPRFKISKRVKGFAFVEFSSPESVDKACEHYKKNSDAKQCDESEEDDSKNVKSRKASQMSDTEEKSSKKRKTENVMGLSEEKNNIEETPQASKDREANSDSEMKRSANRKRKHEDSDTNIQPKKAKDADTGLQTSDSKEESQKQDNTNNNSADETEKRSKHKRKHKKKKADGSERPSLRVMSKYEWKSYRNRYLALQRSTMSHIKKQIMLETQELRDLETSHKSETATEPPKKGLQFQPGVILKVALPKPIENSTEVKDKVKANATVAYIDAPLGHSELFIRCHNQEEALSIVQNKKLQNLGSVQLLEGADEQSYWQKIEDERNLKFSVPLPHKKRGRDKIIAKAAKLAEQKNKHIYFEE